MKQVWVFRHGQTDWNAAGRMQGQIDVPLNSEGRRQAAALIPILQETGVQALLCSDLSRARETAEIVAAGLGGLRIFKEPRLREVDGGAAQGLLDAEITERFGAELLRRWKSVEPVDVDIGYPGGETAAQVMTRAFAAIESFLISEAEASGWDRIGVCTHAGVIRRLLQRLLLPETGPIPIPVGALYALSFDPLTKTWRAGSSVTRQLSGVLTDSS